MIRGFSLFGHRVSVFIRKVTVVDGVKSILPNGRHCIMMDFEDCSLRQAECEIARLQNKFRLGSADIFQSSDSNHFHIYIWTAVDLRRLLTIMLDATHEDWKHAFFSMKRKHSVLRLTDKSGSKITYIESLTSVYPDSCSEKDLANFVRYQTANRGGRN